MRESGIGLKSPLGIRIQHEQRLITYTFSRRLKVSIVGLEVAGRPF
jgi:hypothetical protein